MSGDTDRPDWQYALVLLVVLVFLCGVLYEAHALVWWFTGLLTQLVSRFEVHVETDWRGVAACAVSAVLVVYVWRAPASWWAGGSR